jgi:hypothetical protein
MYHVALLHMVKQIGASLNTTKVTEMQPKKNVTIVRQQTIPALTPSVTLSPLYLPLPPPQKKV